MEFPRIRDLREDHDKSQAEIADLLHLQRTVYRRYELGEREAPAWVLAQLADFYNVSTDYLFGRTNDPRPPRRK
ncbi:MAG: helix-turn-helix transcriptional regulator [Oscillospiraceae bacterium]|nr:helix-turn-helix transcriptional regulator [Oscillospiraceae bacterium]